MKFSIRIVLLFLVYVVELHGQNWNATFLKDTTFSVINETRKLKKKYPELVPVKEFSNLDITSERSVVYYSFGGRDLLAEVFYPAKKAIVKIPAVILIHGGGWASGDRSHLVPMAQRLAENGFFATTVEHRLSPEAKYPAAIVDLKTAIKWVKSNAEIYHVDTTKIAVLGCSSGATLASLLAVTGQNDQFNSHPMNTKATAEVQALVNIDGVLDFLDASESGKDDDPDRPSAGARWFGYTYSQNPQVWIEASPVQYVDVNTPPTIFINSALPRFHAGRDLFVEVLSEHNIYYEIHSIKDTPHPFWLFHPWFDKTWPKVVLFLNKALNK